MAQIDDPKGMIEVLVVDTAAFIKQVPLEKYAKACFTVPEVLDEIRDGKSRAFYESLSIPIQEREPLPEDLKYVIEKAKETGDFITLSRVDLRVLALQRTFHREMNVVVEGQLEEKKEGYSNKVPGWVDPGEEEDDDDEGWIHPKNLKEVQMQDPNVRKEEEVIPVGCITSDYAMQNVILYSKMILVSIDGYRVKSVRRFILTCKACMNEEKNPNSKYCSRCGNYALIKVPYVMRADGTRMCVGRPLQRRYKGLRYNIPIRKGGKKNKDIVLRAPDHTYAPSTARKDDIFDPDYVFFSGDRKHLPSQQAEFGFGKRNPNEAKKLRGKKKKHNR